MSHQQLWKVCVSIIHSADEEMKAALAMFVSQMAELMNGNGPSHWLPKAPPIPGALWGSACEGNLLGFAPHCIIIADKGRPRSKKVTESGRGKRYSYKLPQEYNIETVVVADPAMVSHHGADAARRFILTILNMVGELQSALGIPSRKL